MARRVGSARDAGWIVEHAESETTADGRPASELARTLADRRAAGEPLQYVLGRWPFREIELVVDRRVLIPRPETEQVVERALGELARITAQRRGDGRSCCVDLGTGSGAIALSLAFEAPTALDGGLEIWATDESAAALDVARANCAAVVASRPPRGTVRFARGRWFEALPAELAGAVDLVVSNPPYVSEAEYDALDPSVRDWEPPGALVAATADGVPGFAAIAAIVAEAPRWLGPSGSLVVELAPHQASAAVAAARAAGFDEASVENDLAGRERVLIARRH